MPNLALPETVTAGTIDHPGMHQAVNRELNKRTRDTGWRNLSGLLANGWTLRSGGYVAIRREDDKTTLAVLNLDGSAATSNVFVPIGADDGTRVSGNFRMATALGLPTTSVSNLFRASDTGEEFYLYAQAAGFAMRKAESATPASSSGPGLIVWQFPCELNWPTYLPPAA